MLTKRLGAIAGLVGLLLAAAASPSSAASKIGVASVIKNDVTASVGGRLVPGSSLVEQEVVKTGAESVAQLLFLDQTSLTVGPKAQVKLDKFVFDPNRSVGKVVLSATKGAFRFVSGAQDPHTYQINTPVATIGVRGTIFSCNLYAELIVCVVEEGSAIIGGITVPAGQALVIYRNGDHDGPFTPDGSFFTVQGRIPVPLFGRDLGPLIDQVQGDNIGDIVADLKSHDMPPHEEPGCEDIYECEGY